MREPTPCVIFDMDGTLADGSHREHLIPNPRDIEKAANPDYFAAQAWNDFFGAMWHDKPHAPVVRLAKSLVAAGVPIVICTGRPERYRAVTIDWLRGIELTPHAMVMRGDADFRPSDVAKSHMLDLLLRSWDPWLVVEDMPNDVAMWRRRGLTCLQCRDIG